MGADKGLIITSGLGMFRGFKHVEYSSLKTSTCPLPGLKRSPRV